MRVHDFKMANLRLITNDDDDAPALTRPQGSMHAVAPLPEADGFDRLLDEDARRVSRLHWTPARVCHRAAELLALQPGERLLDVGSGIGKLCLLASQHSAGHFVGIEQRAPLVAQARSLAARLGSTAEFLHGDAFGIDWKGFAALYFYNPFDEVLFPSANQIDLSIQTGIQVFNRLLEETQTRLVELAPGRRVMSFHGIGGPMPSGFDLQVSEEIGDGELQLWVRR